VCSLQVSAWNAAPWQMYLAGKVLLKRRVRALIGVKKTISHAELILFRKTARVVQPLQYQVVAFANGWDMGVWRLQVLMSPHNLAVEIMRCSKVVGQRARPRVLRKARIATTRSVFRIDASVPKDSSDRVWGVLAFQSCGDVGAKR